MGRLTVVKPELRLVYGDTGVQTNGHEQGGKSETHSVQCYVVRSLAVRIN